MTDNEKNLLTILESSEDTFERVYTMLARYDCQDSGDEIINECDKQVIKSLFEGVQRIKKEGK